MNGGLFVEYDVIDLVNLGVAIAVLAAIVLTVFYVFRGGLSFILSGGQEEKIREAVNSIRYAVIGFVIVVFAVTGTRIIGAILGYEFLGIITFDRVSELMGEVIDRVINSSGGSSSSAPSGGGTLR